MDVIKKAVIREVIQITARIGTGGCFYCTRIKEGLLDTR